MRIYLAGSARVGGDRLASLFDAARRQHWDVFDWRELGRLAGEDMAATARAQASALDAHDFQARLRTVWHALEEADVLVLVEPAGRAAHFEAGLAMGRGKPVIVWLMDGNRPELPFASCARSTTLHEVVQELHRCAERLRPAMAVAEEVI